MQGQSAREKCPLLIMKSLLKNEMSFEKLVSTLPNSRGTINKYLSELHDKKFVSRRGRRGKYYLTPKGKKELVRRLGKSSEEAFNEYIRTIIQLAREGHVKILTKEEENKIDFPVTTELPLEVDIEGASRLGIQEGQIFALRILQESVKNLKKQGINTGILVEGKKHKFAIGTKKIPEEKHSVLNEEKV
jgi:DNA-binding PadR family transcriptional regulator